jgi:hypothetical protein
MRKFYSILAALFLTSALFAQIPQKMSYQAIIRDAASNLVANQGIGMRLTILDAMNPVFVETHSATTDVNGLVTVTVGAGTPVTGTLATVNWGSGVFTIKTETDISALGGTTYTVIGTSDVMSIPYALYVKTAADATFSGDYNDLLLNKPVMDGSETKVNAGTRMTVTGNGTVATPYVISATPLVGGFTHYLGEDVGDGIIFYIYTGSDGKERALVANYNETVAEMQNPVSTTYGDKMYDGFYNTFRYINSPARTYVESLGPEWYVPAIDELSYMWQNRFHLNQGLNDHGAGAAMLTVDARYVSSTEWPGGSGRVYSFDFLHANSDNSYSKANTGTIVRAIRTLYPKPTVTTDTPVHLTSTSCTSGGNVTSDGGSTVTAYGVCWNAAGAPSLSNSSTTDGSGTGTFTSTITGLTLGNLYFIRAYATNFEGTRYGDEETYVALGIGDSYQGGYVAYIFQSGDPGYVAGQVHGIIVAPNNLASAKYGCSGTQYAGTAGTALGTGLSNTVNQDTGCPTGGIAAELCNQLNLNTYGDWYLPSKDDLNKLYLARTLITGGFSSGIYWSSSSASTTNAWCQDFSDGTQYNNRDKSINTFFVRPIRYF